MRSDEKNRTSAIERIRCRLSVDKKKTVMAVCLIGVMVIMWGRVLIKKGPEEAQSADSLNDTKTSQQSIRRPEMQFVELPNIAGRNDTITRDFFAPAGWRNFSKGTGAENSADNKNTGEAVAGDGTKELAAKITGGLELQAVWMSHQPRASVNGKPVVTGDILQIRDGVNKYDCEVVKIEETKVHVRCGTVQVILKMQGVLK